MHEHRQNERIDDCVRRIEELEEEVAQFRERNVILHSLSALHEEVRCLRSSLASVRQLLHELVDLHGHKGSVSITVGPVTEIFNQTRAKGNR